MTEAASDAPISPVAPPAAQISGLLSAGKRRRLRLPIAAVLVAGFGTLMLAAVASVLILGLSSAGRNTFALLNDKADLAIDSVSIKERECRDRNGNPYLLRVRPYKSVENRIDGAVLALFDISEATRRYDVSAAARGGGATCAST